MTCPCECSTYGVNWMVREDHWQMTATDTYMPQGEDESHYLSTFLVAYDGPDLHHLPLFLPWH